MATTHMKETAAAKFERQHMDSPDQGTLVPRGSMGYPRELPGH
nr:S.Tag peptide [Plasmid pPV]